MLILTSVVWLHEWFPALVVVAFVVWVFLHKRLEGDLGVDLLHRWQRLWPPATVVLVPLLTAGTVAYWIADQPITTKLLPIALNLLALATVVFGSWWQIVAPGHRQSREAR